MASTSHFDVVEHMIYGQHIREYPNATRSQSDEALQLAVKHYKPKRKPHNHEEDSITVIACHANGFPKEIYEPLWDSLYETCARRGVAIRGLWFADSSHQGASGVLNEDIQGDDPSWLDHSRDLLLLVNQFRNEIRRPVVGIAHSMGCAQIINLSFLHPRLFTSLILIEPIVASGAPRGPHPALPAVSRPDVWPSQAAAEQALAKNRVFRDWDSQVLAKFARYGLRALPTSLHPSTGNENSENRPVTLATSKHQEAWSYSRPHFEPLGIDPEEERLLYPDLDENDRRLLTRAPVMHNTMKLLPTLRPSVMYIFGKKSPFSAPQNISEKMELTGTGLGGSGGAAVGNVSSAIIDTGHFPPCENVEACAEQCAEGLSHALETFKRQEQFHKWYGSKKSDAMRLVSSREYIEILKQPTSAPRPVKEKL